MKLPRPIYIAYRAAEMFAQIGSRLANAVLFNGSTRQTVSARAHIEQWPRGRDRINAFFRIFGVEDHCADAWGEEVKDALATIERNQSLLELTIIET